MSALKIIAIVLIVAGIGGLVYQQFTYTKATHDVDLGPLELSVKEKRTVNIPLWASIAAIAAGVVLLVVPRRRGGASITGLFVIFAAVVATMIAGTAFAAEREDHQRKERTITVVCESSDGNRHRCAADTLGQITLGRQLTEEDKCVEGRTWGYDSDAIWVDRGCRADTRFGVRLMREISGNHCVLNRTWGAGGSGVWVSNGCRAEFALKTR